MLGGLGMKGGPEGRAESSQGDICGKKIPTEVRTYKRTYSRSLKDMPKLPDSGSTMFVDSEKYFEIPAAHSEIEPSRE